MIATGFETRIKVQEIVENQLPSYVVSDFPKTSEFLKQYYISQEYQGGSIDIVENLDQYLRLDNLTTDVISGISTLSVSIGESDSTIVVTNTKGYPHQYGLLQIDNEIITYTGITTNSFTGCIRGFSGITEYDKDGELVFTSTKASSHTQGANITNLSSLFLKEFYRKIKFLLTPGLENVDFIPELDVNKFIKQSKNFYQAKGTDESFRILFNILYKINPEIVDLEKFVIKPSQAEFRRSEVVTADVISGDPLKLIGQTLYKQGDSVTNASISHVELVKEGLKEYFRILLFVGYTDETNVVGNFSITPSTKVLENISIGSSIISVDSTIGFPSFGTLVSGINTNIAYTSKSVNQFFGCVGIGSTIYLASDIRTNDIYYGYEDGDLTKKSEIRITGVLSSYTSLTDTFLSSEGEKIYVKNIGDVIKNPSSDKTFKETFANSWIYNTSSRYQVETISGSSPLFNLILYSNTDKSSLKVGDRIDIVARGSQDVLFENALVTNINTSNTKSVTISASGFSPINGYAYDIRRKLKKANSSSNPDLFGSTFGNNTLISNTLNVYNESDEYFYVASNSLPSYSINVSFATTAISDASPVAFRIQDQNPATLNYRVISFASEVPFITGDALYYTPENDPLDGLEEGIYYIEVLNPKNKIKLYSSKSFIIIGESLEFNQPLNDGKHTFTLLSQKDRIVGPQKVLKKFPNQNNILAPIETETPIDTAIGMMINGVEIINYKSSNKIYYGPIKSVGILNGGSGYDVVNPPRIQVSSPSSGETAKLEPIIQGELVDILVDPHEFDIGEALGVTISGGNNFDCLLEPVTETVYREVSFEAREIRFGGGLDIGNDTITFKQNHNFVNGEPIVYSNNGNNSLGIGAYLGSNANQNKTLEDSGIYYAKVVNDKTIKIHGSYSDYLSGINTVGFTTMFVSGIHKFLPYNGKNIISKINIVSSNNTFTYKKLHANASDVSKEHSLVTIINHGFKNGEIVEYGNIGTPITGLSTSNRYYVLALDNDRFRLCNAGIGGSIRSFYDKEEYVVFGSVGVGTHTFKYPKISIDVKISNSVGVVTATPIVRGSIIDVNIHRKGSGYGSKILNLHNKPTTKFISGKGASLSPVISNGRLVRVNIQNRGYQYYSTPNIIITGEGVGAKVRPIIDNEGRITQLIIVNGGIGYNQTTTNIKVIPAGINCILDPNVRDLTINNNKRFGNEILIDRGNYVQYGYVGYSTNIGNSEFGDNGLSHSPIIGWTYDGCPIYGRYGLSDPKDLNSAIKILSSGYELDASSVEDRPSEFDEGIFVEDYRFTDTGDLDFNNGRFTKTLDFPNGVYAYFASETFPYFIGNKFNYLPVEENFSKYFNQDYNFNSTNLVRNTFPYRLGDPYSTNDFIIQPNQISSQQSEIVDVERGQVDDYEIVESGDDYSIGDRLIFDNSGTDGGGATGYVSELNGKEIYDINTIISSFPDSTMHWKNENTVLINTKKIHNFYDNDNINISGITSDSVNQKIKGSYLIDVPFAETRLVSSIAENPVLLSNNNIDIVVTDIPSNIGVGDSIAIFRSNGTREIFGILNIFEGEKILRVNRGTVTSIGHTASSVVRLLPSKFELKVRTDSFLSKENNIVYFNAQQSVGTGTEFGIDNSVQYIVGSKQEQVSIPSQSIYLPNHPFQNGQKVSFRKTSQASPISCFEEGRGTFLIPSGGNSQTVYVIKKSKDYIGLTTSVGLTTNTGGVFFASNGSNISRYSLESQFDQIKCDIDRCVAKVTLTKPHTLKNGDFINLKVNEIGPVGIGTSTHVKIKYDSEYNRLLVDTIGFSSTSVNLQTNSINIPNNNFVSGDKVFYRHSGLAISGLSTGDYYIFKDSKNTIQLCKSYKDSISDSPSIISFSSVGGNNHQISLINPKLKFTEYKTPTFLLSDDSLVGYKFKLFTDINLSEEFYSERIDNTFNVSGVGTVGVSSEAYLSLEYSPHLPKTLYYAIQKDGKVIKPDEDTLDYSQIEFVENSYNSRYSVSNVSEKTFDISLLKYPNSFKLNSDNTTLLEYTTKSTNDIGGISKITIPFGGTGYKKVPSVSTIKTKFGNSANIILKSNTIGKINSVRVLNLGFDYAADKTLKPQSYVSPIISLTDSDSISEVIVLDGGREYSTPPKLIIYNPISNQIPEIGRVIPKMGSGTIEKIIIEEKPIGLNPIQHKIIAINNDNGIVINQMQSSTTGIVTCFLSTPLLGYVNPPFKVGDKVFVENVERNDETGTGFNSEDYGYDFFEVINYFDTNPIQVEYTLSGLTTNPGIAKTFQFGYPAMVNYNNYPKFEVVQEKLTFYDQEQLLVLDGSGYSLKDIFVTESFKDYIKVFGTYELIAGQKIKGKNSGVIAKINSVRKNTGFFEVDYSLKESYGWNDNIGFISDDLQFIADNDYYQNLSYTIRSPLEYKTTVDPVNRVLHTSGLKNFADTRIENSITTILPTTTLIDSINTIDLVNDAVRVDTIYNLDLAIDVYASETRSKYIKLKNRKLTDYIECRSNRVLLIDDISGFFRNKENVKDLNVSILEYPISQKYSNLLIQIKDYASFDLKIYELVIINNSDDVFALEKTIVSNTNNDFGTIEVVLEKDYDSVVVYFKPKDPYTKDYDIKILESKFNSNLAGLGSTSIGFVTLTGRNSTANSGITTNIIKGNVNDVKALFVMSQVINNTTQEMNYFETYLTNDGTNTFMAESCFDSRIFEFTSGNYIGTFRSNINSGILNFEYQNTSSNPVTVRSRVIGFGQTSIGIGTYQFASEDQIEGTERTLKYESSSMVSIGATDILSVYSYDISAVKSYIRVSVGDTSALHQVVNIHDNFVVYTTQYPYLAVNQDSGIGTFGGRIEDFNMILSFYPDSIYSGSEVSIEMFNEIINSDIDYLNIPQQFYYGKVTEEMYMKQYDALNGKRINRLSFDARWNKTPIFVKTFNPKSNTVVNKQTGVFTMKNHFFSDGEEVIYTPGSSLFGIPAIPMGIGATQSYTGIVTTILPNVVYVNRLNKDQFRLSTRKEYESVGIFVTFTSTGSGNIHTIEMAKKNEKTIITLNGVIQAPLTTTNLKYPLIDNVGGVVGAAASIVCLSGIGSIFPTDVLKIDNEYMSVVNIGYGDSNIGPIINSGPYALVSVDRGTFGSIATDHYDGDIVEVLTGGYNIVGNKIYFVSEPKGSGIGVTIDRDTGIPLVKSSFNGRVYLRSDYTNNKVYDDISPQFTGIGQSFTLTQNGLTTTGVEPGSGILIINGIFQTPTTENNVGNNYFFEEDTAAGLSTVTFTGITSEGDGSLIVTDADVNQNQLPRNGLIVSLGSTPGLGYAPLVGASVTAVIGAGGSIVSVGLGLTDNLGSGYRGLVSIGVTDPNHTGTAASITAIAGIGGTLSFIINDGGSGYSTSGVKILPPEPIYENLPVIGVFRSGIGETTDTGIGLLVNVEIGPSEFTPVGRFADAAILIEQNKTLIAEVAVGRMLNNYSGFSVPGGNQNCIDDVESVLSSIIYDLKFGGNESVYNAAKIYIDNAYLSGEEEESIYAFEQARDMAIQAMRNEPITIGGYSSLTQYFNLSVEGDISGLPGVYNSGDCSDVASAITQFVGIVTNAIGISTLPTKTVSTASLYQVSSFKIPRTGYSFQIGDVFKVVGLVTDKNLSEPLEEFQLTVLDIFTDRFAAWQFGELDFIDPITNFQDGKRVRFPLYYNSELLSFEKNLEDEDSAAIDLNAVVLIFVNGVIQDPYKNYRFEGGTSIVFTTPPKPYDNVSIFFYRGGRGIDSVLINVRESIKDGDTVQLNKRNSIPQTVSQDKRKVSTIFASDTVETNLYMDQGIDEVNYKPLDWYRQKADISIDGLKISKARDSIEGMVYPTAKIIKSLAANDPQIFVDDAQFFNYEENESDIVISYLDAFIINNNNPVAAAVTAVVSMAGTIQELIINNPGDGYTGIGNTLYLSIAQPDNIIIEGTYATYGIGVTATAESPIVNGKITTINITNPGVGYTYTNPPNVICPLPAPNYENVLDITRVQGFSGIITGITTTTGTNGHPLALKFFTRSTSYQGLQVGFPIYVYDTITGNGLVSVGSSDINPIGIGTYKLNNIYEVRSIVYNGLFGQFVVNIKSNSNISGVVATGTTSNPVGRFSWGRFFGLKRSKTKPISLDLRNYVVDAGLSTFPEIHRRGFGLRSTGALRKDLG
jgi:hypothetical protein